MKWASFYDHFPEWDGPELMRRIRNLSEFGPSGEIVEVLESVPDEKAACDFLLRADEDGTVFSGEELTDIADYVDVETLEKLIQTSVRAGVPFSGEQRDYLSGYVDESVLPGLPPEEPAEVSSGKQDRPAQKKGPGFMTGLLAMIGMGEENKPSPKRRFRIGDHVRVRYRGQEGTVVDINGDYYMVSLNDGKRVDSWREEELEKAW